MLVKGIHDCRFQRYPTLKILDNGVNVTHDVYDIIKSLRNTKATLINFIRTLADKFHFISF